MKLELFEKLIRKVVREEVDMAIERHSKSINERLNEISIQKPINNTSHMGFDPTKLEVPVNKLANGIKDPSLREIFENTDPLDDNKVTSVLDNFRNLQESAFNSESPNPSPIPKGPEAAFMKDYSGLMKAIDEKKNFRP
jgi:hypothetical protein